MPCPIRRRGSGNWYFRGTIPKALLPKIAAMPKHMRPAGWSVSGDIVISLKTSDRELAKGRCAEVTAEVANTIRSLSWPERSLNKQERVALAGDAYRTMVDAHRAEPGETETWQLMEELWKRSGDEEVRAEGVFNVGAVDQYCAVTADAVLRRKGEAVDAQSRELLIEEIRQTLMRAFKQTEAYAEGDYSPDANLSRFPPWPGQPRTVSGTPYVEVILTDLLDGWSQKKKKPRVRTVDDFRSAVQILKQHLGHESVSRITAEDIIAWKDAMVAEGKLTAKTINEKRIAAIRAIYGWGLNKSNRKITGENVASGIRVEADGRVERSKSFTIEEARKILKAALKAEADAGPGVEALTIAARRWAPWICCYTGARIVEVTQLRRQDVRKVEGVWVFDITPEAGETKTNKARFLPVHSDLITQGFVEFVNAGGEGPLFYDPARVRHVDGRAKKALAESVANKLAAWVRQDVGIEDKRIRPNHAWRHWFINQCRANRVDREARYFMVGHVAGDGKSDVGNTYGDALVPFLKTELEKIPAFQLLGASGS